MAIKFGKARKVTETMVHVTYQGPNGKTRTVQVKPDKLDHWMHLFMERKPDSWEIIETKTVTKEVEYFPVFF